VHLQICPKQANLYLHGGGSWTKRWKGGLSKGKDNMPHLSAFTVLKSGVCVGWGGIVRDERGMVG
jgi:hypothetical protein